jgi:hypothetical protein
MAESDRIYKPDEELIDRIQSYYSLVLDQAGLNTADPVAASIGFFNNSGKLFVDPVKIGRTVIFFTRPNLNFFSYGNIKKSRIFSYYLSSPMGAALMRLLMYPDIAGEMYYGIYGDENNKVPVAGRTDDSILGGEAVKEGENSLPLIKSNFIPFFTNVCVSSDAGKDIMLDKHFTEPNFSDDKLTYAGGIDSSLGTGELTLAFEDIYYSPVMIILFLWVMYMHYVSKGICGPHWEYIVRRIIDYTCSVYIFMLGTDGQTIVRWVKYGGCFPGTIPFGAIQHAKDANVDALRNLSVNFSYNFMCPMDPLVLTEFNMISGPSIYDRLRRQNGDKDASVTNSLIRYHRLSLENAARLLEEYPPEYEGTFYSRSLPKKRLEVKTEEAAGASRELLEDLEANPLLKNRANGLISSSFYGVPYIAEGNRLMFV